jgi:hypothetical protein
MTERMLIGTRKGLFILERGTGSPKAGLGGGWRVAHTAFVGDPITIVLADPRDGTLYAGISLGHFGCKLHRSSDGGATWEEVGVPKYPVGAKTQGRSFDPNAPGLMEPASLELLWALEPGGRDEPGVLWAGTIPGGLFRSPDRGATWALNMPLWDLPARADWSGGGYDHAGIHSVCVNPADSRKISVAVSTGGVWLTEDGGNSWVPRAKGMRATYLPPELQQDARHQDAHRMVQSPSRPEVMWLQHHNGMYRTANGGQQWDELDAKPSTFGFAVAVHPHEPDTAWFVPAVADVCRVPVDGRMVVNRTRDGGKTFETLHAGLPQSHAYHLIYRHGLTVDSTGQHLAMGSTTGALWSTADGGASWATVTTDLPPIACVRMDV